MGTWNKIWLCLPGFPWRLGAEIPGEERGWSGQRGPSPGEGELVPVAGGASCPSVPAAWGKAPRGSGDTSGRSLGWAAPALPPWSEIPLVLRAAGGLGGASAMGAALGCRAGCPPSLSHRLLLSRCRALTSLGRSVSLSPSLPPQRMWRQRLRRRSPGCGELVLSRVAPGRGGSGRRAAPAAGPVPPGLHLPSCSAGAAPALPTMPRAQGCLQ